uniref:Ty3-gypsy retrotransposon protein n=1 Tax=Vitis vinifera TaxID=29760 RepID=A5C5G2_VITVI|nr:hypothetical protein VITISV_004416 [Vitis vinifera]
MTRLSLHNRHMTPLWASQLVVEQNQHFHSQQNKKDFGNKSPCSITNANFSTGSCFRSPTGMSKEENYSNRSNSFNSPFSMAMPVMVTGTTSIEEQLAEMALAITKLTKTVEEKDMQIVSLINKVEAQVQSMSESSQGLNHLPNVASPLDDASHTYRTMQVERQTVESASMQWKDELVVDYINHWHFLSLDCKNRVYEVSSVEMCIQGMHWGLLYILQGILPRTFEELATRAHDMEISIANHGVKKDLIIDQQKERHNGKTSDKNLIKLIQESMTVNTTPIKISVRDKKKKEVKEARPTQENERCRFTLKELEEKKYHFPNFDVPSMLEDLL